MIKKIKSIIFIEQASFFESISEPNSLLALFDHLPDVFLYVKDSSGRFMKTNRTFLIERGMAAEAEILGKTDLDIHPQYWGQRYRDEDQAVMRSGLPLVDQVWLIPDVNGRLEPFISTKIPLFDLAGACIGVAGVRRRLNPADERFNDDCVGIKAAVRMMNENFAELIEIRKLAQIAGLSHSQFNRRFLAMYRMPPSTYLQRVRVHEASRRLVASDRPAMQIALESGFYDQAHMTRTFKKFLGVTPSEFRRLK